MVYARIAVAPSTPAASPSRDGIVKRWRWWAMAAAAIAAALALWRWHPGPAERGPLANPSRIATGAAGSHVVLDGMGLDLAPESAVVVDGDATRGVLVVLDRGSVLLDVEGRVAKSGFVVQAGEVRVRVVGTRFKVSRLDDGASVEVERGVVDVDARGSTVRVNAGETWRSEPAPTIAPPPPQPAPPPEPARSRAVRRGAARTAPSKAVGLDAGAPAPPAPPGSQQLYETAARIEVSDPARAILIYRELVARGDAWTADALFAQGRLEAARGDRAGARATLGEYLTRFPRGPNADDARLLLDRMR
jgi:hypothetical protein